MKPLRGSTPSTAPARIRSGLSALNRVRLRHVDTTHYSRTRTELGWARGRVGSVAPSLQSMEAELAARAPRPGEGRQSKPDPYINKTIQPEALEQLPTEVQIRELRGTVDAMGRVVQQPIDRLDEHDEVIAAHMELSLDGEHVNHDKLTQGIEQQRRASLFLGGSLFALGLIATIALLLGGLAFRHVGTLTQQHQQLILEVRQLRSEIQGREQLGAAGEIR